MPVPKFVQAKKTTLKSSITAAETTEIVLKNLVDIYGNALAMSDFEGTLYLTIEPGSDNEEILSATDFTVNSDGSVSLDTGIARGLTAKSPYGAAGTARAHAAGVIVIVSNNPQLYDAMMDFVVNLEDAQTVAGVKTFSSVPKTSAGNPTADEDLARKAYVDSVVGGVAITNQLVIAGDAGETVAAGDLIYFDSVTANEWMLCDADTAATVENVILGIAQGAGTDGNPITSGVLLRGVDSNQTGMTPGALQYAGNTAGAIAESAGTTEVTVGLAYDATTLYFNPRFNQMLTEDQQDALAGTSGTPSNTNKYVTSDDVSDAAVSAKIVRATGTALPALSGENLTNIPEKESLFTANVAFSNTITETTIMTFSLGANQLGTGNILKIRIPVTDFGLQSAASDTFTLKLKYGATTVATATFVNSGTNFNAGFGYIEAVLVGAGTTSSQEGSILFTATATATGISIGAGATGTATEDSTGALTVAVTGQFSVANANSDFTTPHGYAEIIK